MSGLLAGRDIRSTFGTSHMQSYDTAWHCHEGRVLIRAGGANSLLSEGLGLGIGGKVAMVTGASSTHL